MQSVGGKEQGRKEEEKEEGKKKNKIMIKNKKRAIPLREKKTSKIMKTFQQYSRIKGSIR